MCIKTEKGIPLGKPRWETILLSNHGFDSVPSKYFSIYRFKRIFCSNGIQIQIFKVNLISTLPLTYNTWCPLHAPHNKYWSLKKRSEHLFHTGSPCRRFRGHIKFSRPDILSETEFDIRPVTRYPKGSGYRIVKRIIYPANPDIRTIPI